MCLFSYLVSVSHDDVEVFIDIKVQALLILQMLQRIHHRDLLDGLYIQLLILFDMGD